MIGLRIDKWLWAARFFKTRALATRACELGRIECNELKAKPSREVHIGDLLQVKNAGGVFEIEVKLLSDTRGPATVAQTLYAETESSKAARQRLAEERRETLPFEMARDVKPSKRDRRELDRFRGRG